jgi:hypothetical protein
MSAFTHAIVRCDYMAPEGTPPPRGCKASVHDGTYQFDTSPEFPFGACFWTKAEVRRAARELGWAVGVHSGSMRRGGSFDYCPDHKPEDG